MLPQDLITPKAAARLVGCHVSTVLRWILSGKLRGWRVAGVRYKVSKADVQAMIQPVEAQEPAELPRTDAQMADAARAATERLRARGYRV